MTDVKALADDVTWISVREAARILKVSHTTLHKMIDAGEIETVGTFTNRKDVVLERAYIEGLAQKNAQEEAA